MQCPSCNNVILFDDMLWEKYCPKCGLVVEEKMLDYRLMLRDELERWTTLYGSASSPMYPFKGIGRHMGSHLDPVEESYARAYPYFMTLWGALRLPYDIRTESALIYRKCARMGLTRGRFLPEMTAAITHVATYESGVIRSFQKVLDALDGIDKGRVKDYYTVVTRELNRKSYPFRMNTRGNIWLVSGLLRLDDKVIDKAWEILDEMLKEKTIGRRNQFMIAAITIYSAAKALNVQIRQKKIAEMLHVSERGIRRFKKMRPIKKPK